MRLDHIEARSYQLVAEVTYRPLVCRDDRMAGLMMYLAGPGRANEHEEPHLVAGDYALMAWHDDNELNRDAALDIAKALDRAQQFYKTAAVAEWNAAARNRRPAHTGRETLQPSAELWNKYANEVSALREKLATTPHDDHAAWAQAARETSAAFGAWSRRIEPTPGPLAGAARELAKSAQLRRYPTRPAAALPSARGATMILLAAASKSDRAAYALMFRQLAQTARAIHDMHKATDDLRRVRGLAAAVTAATKVVEASATAHTITPQPLTMDALREQHPGASEEVLRARLIAERSRGGWPVPSTLTRAEMTLQQAGPSRPQEPVRDRKPNPGIER